MLYVCTCKSQTSLIYSGTLTGMRTPLYTVEPHTLKFEYLYYYCIPKFALLENNISKYFPSEFKSIRDQFEYESFYIRCHVDHTPSDPKDMTLTKGTLVRVVNSVFSPNSWLAWSVDENTGIDVELKRIPSPARYVTMLYIYILYIYIIYIL